MTNNPEADTPFRVIAIDGGAASGKSSTSRRLAEMCHWLHVDTGSHYRAVALAALQAGLEPRDTPELRQFIASLELSSHVERNESHICFNAGEPPRPADLRSEPVNQAVSPLSAIPFVREAVKAYQQQQVELARDEGFKG
ncbi:MAG: (d)CMP kinase, partial [Puniceicoccaceae bacterium]